MDNSVNSSVFEKLVKIIIEMPEEKRIALLNQIEHSFIEKDESVKRIEPRRNYDKPIYFDFENYTYEGIIKDISASGIFIETKELFQVGQMIMMNIPDVSGARHVRVAGEIARVKPEGIGVKFMSKSKV